MSEQVAKTSEYLAKKRQTDSITWKECANLPVGLSNCKLTVINGMVYCGGGAGSGEQDEYIVCCYDPSQDKWSTLLPLPVRRSGLGQINGKLVAVGGVKSDLSVTNEVYTYDESSQKWEQTIPPRPIVLRSPGVLSLKSALVVAGGRIPSGYSTEVDIFKSDTSQWYRTDPLPAACIDISLVSVGNTCYALGGYGSGSCLNQALYASVDDLLGNAVPANQTTHSGSSDTQSAWKTLPNTPTYRPAAAVLAGNLLAVGGDKTSEGGAVMKEIYMYSPSTNSWIHTSDLPAPRSTTAVAVLSSTEILVVGGWNGGSVNTVYKGTYLN